jgi:hypothetical protein
MNEYHELPLAHARIARLDCWAASTFLPDYYDRLGYAFVGDFGGPNGGLLLQKRLNE